MSGQSEKGSTSVSFSPLTTGKEQPLCLQGNIGCEVVLPHLFSAPDTFALPTMPEGGNVFGFILILFGFGILWILHLDSF